MPRRYRARKPGRRPPFRSPKPIILVVCEGEKTEPQYFDGYRRTAAIHGLTLNWPPAEGPQKALVEIASRKKREAAAEAHREGDENLAYDSVWCVFDVDTHHHIAEAKQVARKWNSFGNLESLF